MMAIEDHDDALRHSPRRKHHSVAVASRGAFCDHDPAFKIERRQGTHIALNDDETSEVASRAFARWA
jgi:hypothetical protein